MKMYIVCYGTPSPRAVAIGMSDVEPVIGTPIVLRQARLVLYWSAACGGLYGLVARGPKEGTRITAEVPQYSVTPAEWGELTEEASAEVAAWPAV